MLIVQCNHIRKEKKRESLTLGEQQGIKQATSSLSDPCQGVQEPQRTPLTDLTARSGSIAGGDTRMDDATLSTRSRMNAEAPVRIRRTRDAGLAGRRVGRWLVPHAATICG